jgi:hypothetical protein
MIIQGPKKNYWNNVILEFECLSTQTLGLNSKNKILDFTRVKPLFFRGLNSKYLSPASSVAGPTIYSRYVNIFVFTDYENNQFLKKWIMIIILNLDSETKLSGWLRQWVQLCTSS